MESQPDKKLMEVSPDKVTIVYTCQDCGGTIRQPATDLVECGTAICAECDIDADLDHFEIED